MRSAVVDTSSWCSSPVENGTAISRRTARLVARGFFGIGIENGKTIENVGTLWRTAQAFGVDFIFTIGGRYYRQNSDTTKAWKHLPLHEYGSVDDFFRSKPRDSEVVGIEIADGSVPLPRFQHPERAIYLLGAEDIGISSEARRQCSRLVVIPSSLCLNVAVAGSIVLYDRLAKASRPWPRRWLGTG